MTISSTTRKVTFTGNGSASVFAFPFKVFQASDLLVETTVVAQRLTTPLVLNEDYTATVNVNQNVAPGGTVTLTAGPLAVGLSLTITSDVPALQPTEFINQGGFYPEVVTASLDRLTILIQQLQGEIDAINAGSGRSFVVPVGVINGVGATGNRVFTIAGLPEFPAAGQLFLNGVLQQNGIDYAMDFDVTPLTLTYLTPLPPQIGDTHEYFYS